MNAIHTGKTIFCQISICINILRTKRTFQFAVKLLDRRILYAVSLPGCQLFIDRINRKKIKLCVRILFQ